MNYATHILKKKDYQLWVVLRHLFSGKENRNFQVSWIPGNTEASAEFKDGKEITATRVAKTPTASTGMEKLGS